MERSKKQFHPPPEKNYSPSIGFFQDPNNRPLSPSERKESFFNNKQGTKIEKYNSLNQNQLRKESISPFQIYEGQELRNTRTSFMPSQQQDYFWQRESEILLSGLSQSPYKKRTPFLNPSIASRDKYQSMPPTFLFQKLSFEGEPDSILFMNNQTPKKKKKRKKKINPKNVFSPKKNQHTSENSNKQITSILSIESPVLQSECINGNFMSSSLLFPKQIQDLGIFGDEFTPGRGHQLKPFGSLKSKILRTFDSGSSSLYKGKIKHINTIKKYGFLQLFSSENLPIKNQPDIFFHVNDIATIGSYNLQAALQDKEDSTLFEFEIKHYQGKKGTSTKAINLKKISQKETLSTLQTLPINTPTTSYKP